MPLPHRYPNQQDPVNTPQVARGHRALGSTWQVGASAGAVFASGGEDLCKVQAVYLMACLTPKGVFTGEQDVLPAGCERGSQTQPGQFLACVRSQAVGMTYVM